MIMKFSIIILVFFVMTISCNSGSENVASAAGDTAQPVTNEIGYTDNSDKKVEAPDVPDESGPNAGIKTPEATTILNFTKLSSGSQSKMDNRSMFVINNKTKFDELWAIAFQQGVTPQKPNIDFSKNSVLILFLGQVNSGGHSIEPLSIQASGDDPLYIISVRHNKPDANCVTTSVLEYPYYFALTDKIKSEKHEFKMSVAERKCK